MFEGPIDPKPSSRFLFMRYAVFERGTPTSIVGMVQRRLLSLITPLSTLCVVHVSLPPRRTHGKVRLLVSDRWVRSTSKLALEGVNEKLLQKCTEAERLENKETLELNAANLAMASVQSHRAEVGGWFGWVDVQRREKDGPATPEMDPVD